MSIFPKMYCPICQDVFIVPHRHPVQNANRKMAGLPEEDMEESARDPEPFITCPHCDGKKQLFAFWDGIKPDGSPFSGAGMRKCDTCDGLGVISLERNARIQEGKNRRAERLSRGLSLHEEATRLGMTAAELSAIEHGKR